MDELSDIRRRLEAVEERNRKVEADKMWEKSYTRRILLFLFTYIAISLYMWAISLPDPWLNAIVPSVGFLLSTLTLPYFKQLWLKNRKQFSSGNRALP